MECLEENNLLEDLKHVAGTSGGCVPALRVALGYNAEATISSLEKT